MFTCFVLHHFDHSEFSVVLFQRESHRFLLSVLDDQRNCYELVFTLEVLVQVVQFGSEWTESADLDDSLDFEDKDRRKFNEFVGTSELFVGFDLKAGG